MPDQNPTADYRKYPKGPNFLAIVIAFFAFALIAVAVFFLFLRKDATKVIPHSPNGQPNSYLVQPAGSALRC